MPDLPYRIFRCEGFEFLRCECGKSMTWCTSRREGQPATGTRFCDDCVPKQYVALWALGERETLEV